MYLKPIALLGVIFLTQSCSSIINGTTQKVTVTSNVQGAEVTLNGAALGRTPVTTRVKREKTSLLIVRKEGYKDYQQQLNTKLDPWFWGNVLIGGLVGSTTDSVTGATHLIDPETIFIQMEPESGSGLSKDPKDAEIRNFIFSSYSNLIKDIKAGKGDYLKSLYSLLGVKENKQKETLDKIRSMVTLYPTVHELSEEMAKFYKKNQ